MYYKGHFYENKTKKTFSPTLAENELCIKKIKCPWDCYAIIDKS